MNDTVERPHTPAALVANIGHRDFLPAGWRPIYDQLIFDLHKLNPELRVQQVKAKLGKLCIYLEKPGGAGAYALIANAAAATQDVCEECGQSAQGHTTSGTFRRLCEAHHRTTLAAEAARVQLFDGDLQRAEHWIRSYLPHLRENAATRATRSPEGLEDVLNVIGQISAGVYL